MFSPDGRWLVYISNESGQDEVYVQAYPGPGGKWSVSTEGGTEPLWSRDGRELFYRQGQQMMAVAGKTESTFSASKPQLLFRGLYLFGEFGNRNYDISPDGQRFLMISQEEAPDQIHVVLNWFEEVKRLVPTGE